MSITMQGSWTVSVKSKSAAYDQRFVVAGADSGNGTYAGDVSTPSVFVSGDSWSITIQNDPGTGWVDSDDRIKFPAVSSGNYVFDIESNDAGPDEDFNDLILTCSTPQTATDFILYGHVSYYSSSCIFNPCFRGWVVIDTPLALAEALKHPFLRKPIEELYPERLEEGVPPRPGPVPDPPPFRPMVLPLLEDTVLPPKRAQVLRVSEVPAMREAKSKAKQSEANPGRVSTLQTISLSESAAARYEIDRVRVAEMFDHLVLFCDTGPLPGVALRFQEYDRTTAELAGGPYSGNGLREDLGVCATDINGNYIFRFSRSIAEFIGEATGDVAVGEDALIQAMPDVIGQLLDPMATTGVSYETAPYWNIPLLKRIDICIPKSKVPVPSACQSGEPIQAIGNIFIGPTQPDGSRVGFNNNLGVEGRITAKNTLPGVPQARCAAWAGNLDLFACFIDLPSVTQYTIRHRRRLPDSSWTAWGFFQQEYRHPKIANIGLPNYNGDLVGPFDRTLHVGGGPAVAAKAYDNIESDNAWLFTRRDRKAVISSWLYAPTPGPVQFRIEGYDASGNHVAGAEDTITLFVDNSTPDYAIGSVTMLGAPGGDCALFTLPVGQLNAPLTVTFRANQLQGFMNTYQLSVRKGNIGNIAISGSPSGLIQGAYSHGDDLICSQFTGTFDATLSLGNVTVDVTPTSGGWLETDQPFCTFAVQLGCTTRITNGYNTAILDYGPKQYLLGMEQGS